ncbi:hypothetical protein BN1195_00823 [Chryseobacterium oranimense G311]|nr:hypothetical protein BN1195_00823 [Chryseobacterium oranimense G311]
MKFKDGTKQIVKIPVEVWKRNTEWLIKLNSNKEIAEVMLDPDAMIPDVNAKNNIWPSAETKPVDKINTKDFAGTYVTKSDPIKLTFFDKNGQLFAKAGNQQEFPLQYAGNNVFTFEEAAITLEFSKDKKIVTFKQAGREYQFTKE